MLAFAKVIHFAYYIAVFTRVEPMTLIHFGFYVGGGAFEMLV